MLRPQGVDRIRSFAKFFKGYMGLAVLVTAALPIPVTMWKLIRISQPMTETDLLATMPRHSIPNESLLSILYILIFVFSELAFVLMALEEYLQDILEFTDDQLLKHTQKPDQQRKTKQGH